MRDPNRRRFLTLLGAAALTAGTARARPLDEVIERNRLRVAVYRDFHPFSYREGGVLKGIDVEVAQAIAERLGVKPDLYEHTAGEAVSDDLRVAIWRGSLFGGEPADIMMHIPYDKEFGLRNPEAVLFAPYQRELFALVRNPERVPSASLIELPEEPIGVEIDSIPDFFLLGTGGGRLRKHVVHFPEPKGAVEALKRGEVAAVLAPRSQIEAALAGAGAGAEAGLPITTVRLPGMMASSWDIGMATRENARDLTYAVGDAVTAMLDDGTMAAIFRRHGVTHTPIPVE
jgi:ABC-type amino acid transport substrate-binding protein